MVRSRSCTSSFIFFIFCSIMCKWCHRKVTQDLKDCACRGAVVFNTKLPPSPTTERRGKLYDDGFLHVRWIHASDLNTAQDFRDEQVG